MSTSEWARRLAKIALLASVCATSGTGVALAGETSGGEAAVPAANQIKVSIPFSVCSYAVASIGETSGVCSAEAGTYAYASGYSSKPCNHRYPAPVTGYVASTQHGRKPCGHGKPARVSGYEVGGGYVPAVSGHRGRPCARRHPAQVSGYEVGGGYVPASKEHGRTPCAKRFYPHLSRVSHHAQVPCSPCSGYQTMRAKNSLAERGQARPARSWASGLPRQQLASQTVNSGLPATGFNIEAMLAMAGVALSLGAGTLMVTRRRSRRTFRN